MGEPREEDPEPGPFADPVPLPSLPHAGASIWTAHCAARANLASRRMIGMGCGSRSKPGKAPPSGDEGVAARDGGAG